jgi:hypothetical protein
MRRLWIGPFVLLASVSSIVACGSAPSASNFNEDPGQSDTSGGTDGGSDTSTSGDTSLPPTDGTPGKDTGGPPTDGLPPGDTAKPPTDTSTGPVTLDDVCDRLADAICGTTTKTCCASRSVAFNETGCRTNVHALCDTLVDEARAGDRTFDASKFDPCAAAWKTLTTTCSVPILTYAKTYGVCYELLDGTTNPGDACGSANDCKTAPGSLPSCGSSGTCSQFFIVGKDQPCNYDGAVKHLCDYGFYCPFTGAGSRCLPAKGLGSGGCSPGGSDPSCGWGNRCDSTSHCAPGLPMGSSCSGDLQCASWSCSGGRCTDPNAEMADANTCGG